MELECPHCGFALRPKPEWAGKRGKCKKCDGRILIPGPMPKAKTPPVTLPASAPSMDVDEDDAILLELADPDDVRSPVGSSIPDEEDAILLELADQEDVPSPLTSQPIQNPFDFKQTHPAHPIAMPTRTMRSENTTFLLKGLAFVLCVPVGVTVAVLLRTMFFPESHGAISNGVITVCCYVAFQSLKSMFGVTE